MSQRRGPKQSPFIGKRVPLVDADGQHVLYKRYIDPSEVVQGVASKLLIPADLFAANAQAISAKKQKKMKTEIAEAAPVTTVLKAECEDLENGGVSAKKEKKKKKRKHGEDADSLANGLNGVAAAADEDITLRSAGQAHSAAGKTKGSQGRDKANQDNVDQVNDDDVEQGGVKSEKRKKRKKKESGDGDGGVDSVEGVTAAVAGDGAAKEDAAGAEPGEDGEERKKKKAKKEKKKKKETAEEDAEDTGVGEDGEESKKKKKEKKKKKTAEAAAAAAAVEKKLTSGGSNADEAGLIRNLLGYKGAKALPVPGFTFHFPVQADPVKEAPLPPAPAAPAPAPTAPTPAKPTQPPPTPAAEESAPQDDGYVPRRVYVGGMPYHWEEDDIREYWSYCGEVESLDLMRFPDSGKFRGIAFITFTTQAGFESALQYDGEQLDGYTLKVDKCKAAALRKGQGKAAAPSGNTSHAYGGDEGPDASQAGRANNFKAGGQRSGAGPSKVPGYNVAYVGNIAFEATLDDVLALFKPYQGYVRLHTDKDSKQHKGYAHVHFPDEEALDRSMELDGYKLLSRKIRVSYGQLKKTDK